MTLFDSGKRIVPFVNILFLINVIIKFIENETKSGVYNVVSENSSLIDIAHHVAHEEGVTEPVIMLVLEGKTSKFFVPTEKLNQFLRSVN
jgi:dTDP-4-dehydrorhamnose reductase